MIPRPPPPASSGRPMPISPARPSSAHTAWSKRSGPASISRSRSSVTLSSRIRRARSETARCSSLKEKSIAAPPYRGARAMPRPTMLMMSRWISLVPPPKVRISVPRYTRSIRPLSLAPGESPFT